MPTDHPKVLRAKNGALPIGLGTVVDLLVERRPRAAGPTTRSVSCWCGWSPTSGVRHAAAKC